jgi:hypothetical protein
MLRLIQKAIGFPFFVAALVMIPCMVVLVWMMEGAERWFE